MLKFKEGYYSDVRVENRYESSVIYRNGNLEESKETTVKRAFIRVFDGDMWYYLSTYKTDSLQEELDSLYQGIAPNKDIGDNPVVKKFQVNKDSIIKFADNCVKDVPIGEKQKLLTDAAAAVEQSEYVKMSIFRYHDKYYEFEFYSSKGADIKYDFQMCGAMVSVSLADGENTFDDYGLKSTDSFNTLNFTVEGVDKFIKESENFLLNAKPVQAGDYPVILAPQVAGVFAHESFGHKSEADFMIGDETMKKEWVLGKKVGADILSIYDSGLEAGSGYAPFDDEGTRASKTYLIKDGVLTGRLHSAVTAVELGEELTGNARAITCEYEPIVRMTSTIIEAGTTPRDELFARVKHGYYIETYKHGSGMSMFTIAPCRSYEIIDGKIAGPVKIVVITGNVFETLGLIDGLSDRAEIVSNAFGGCGKNEQGPLSVSDGGPYVSISKINVQ